ncbi:hypothetical protein H257_12949 [Aphanomyces astaci]|uniref:TOG domain-containing protein n=1 Tax=Aphanomyces astaci TaxID=112090 RepID=W4FW92_APHAT|nr:hypothetical protein H257_12949 [Aphanomyces astaci]ETV71805.1 hypothetical protein H257_12949 [Aphanomyces astaci]|eukprot:XP_009838654.1 hypothetical protein H257_12949 [Aphanomyces astaci]
MAVQDGPYNVKAIESSLQNHVDWMKRIQALQLIQAWAKSEKAHSSPEFVNGIHQLRDLVAEQVADIRSSVSKEASLTISILANNMKDAAFGPLVDVFLTSLLKALGITIEVIASAADSCIQSVLKSSRIGHYAAIPKLVEACASRNASLRKHAMEYMTLTCNQWNPRSMSRHGVPDQISKVLLPALCDANGDVRAASRKCFWAFHAVDTKKALLVFDKLDSATKVKLIEEGGSGFDFKAPTATPSSSYPSGVTSKTTFRSRSLKADGSAKDMNPVVTRLYQPHYFQNRWQRRANLKEAQDLRECTFTPVILRKQLKTNVKHAAVPMLELDKLAIQGDLRGCVSPVNA